MIHNLVGIHETVDYLTDTQICLYYNNEDENYPPHWHTSFEVIMPVISTYRVLCGDSDYHLRQGDILIICPCMIHELFSPPTGERIIFQPGFTNINIKELNLLTSIISPALLITPEEYPEIHPKISNLLWEIKEEYFHSNAYAEASIFSKFLEILVYIGRSRQTFPSSRINSSSSRQKEYVEKFLFITDYINIHFAEDLCLEDIAALAGFSKYHFSRLFKQYTDLSFYKYLNQKRIEHAKTLLLDPQLTVIEVATHSGFSSLSAFLRMFRQFTKCTPTDFRSMYNEC